MERLLELPVQEQVDSPLKGVNELAQTALLNDQLTKLTFEKIASAEKDNEKYYDEETDKLERWAEDKRIALDIRIKQLDQEIKVARKASRQLPTLQEKIQAKKRVTQQERERDQLMLAYHEEKKKIEVEEDRLLTDIEAALQIKRHRERLFAIRWSVRGNTPMGIKAS